MPEHENSSDHQRAFKEWTWEWPLIKVKPLTVNYKNKLWKKDRFEDRF